MTHVPTDLWRLRIVHRTELTYSDTVTTSYNEVRMLPLEEPGQAILSSRLDVEPVVGVQQYADYFGTRVAAFDVHRPHRQLTVLASSVVETFAVPGAAPPSISWTELDESNCADRFEEFLTPTTLTECDQELSELAADLRATSATPSEAARAACELIRQRLTYQVGATGVHTSAIEAWAAKRGVCQDFSHLALALIRAMGIPARYVSGYLHPDAEAEVGVTVTGQSHAWVEWFDGGWAHFDPTNGAPQGHAHVVVGRGRDYRDVPPMKGVYAGPDATGNEVSVVVTRLR